MEQRIDPAAVPAKRLNDLNGTEWVRATKSFMFQEGLGPGHPDAQIERQHPAPFAFRDAERLIRLFSQEGDRVFDPFAGIGSTMKACALSGRRGVGFELNPKFHRWSQERLAAEVPRGQLRIAPQAIRHGDALALTKRLKRDSFDFALTSPPYWSILGRSGANTKKWRKGSRPYSTDARDLGCIEDYNEFLQVLGDYLCSIKRVLRPQRYLAVVVADFRRADRLYPFHADLITAIESSQSEPAARRLVLQGIKIIAQNKKKLYPYGFPTTYVPNIHHHYVLIYRNRVDAKRKEPDSRLPVPVR